jgi:protein AbiQ
MDWYVVDKKYIKYLTQFDSRVGYVEYGERLKLHVGILLTVGDFHYYVPSLLPSPSTRKCPTVWIFTNFRMKLPGISMPY